MSQTKYDIGKCIRYLRPKKIEIFHVKAKLSQISRRTGL